MQSVTIHVAKTNLSRLIEAALAGEEVVIARGSTPVVRLVPITKQTFQVGEVPDFLTPMDEAELDLWEGGR